MEVHVAVDKAAELLEALGLTGDPEMSDTPRRLVEWLSTFRVEGEAPRISTCATSSEAPVWMEGIAFHSLCAHHLLPFFGRATVAYRPSGRLAGLGSLSRTVTWFARQPQVQERLGEQIADHLAATLEPAALMVRLEARQLCVELTQGQQPLVTTWATRGEVPEAWLFRPGPAHG